MKRIIFFVLLFFIAFWVQVSFAQKREKPTSVLIREGNEYLRVEEYGAASRIFLELLSREPDNGEFNYKAGVSFAMGIQKAEAIPYFKKALKILGEDKVEIDLFYYLGKVNQILLNFDAAIENYNKFIFKPKKGDERIQAAQRQVEICHYAKKQIANPVDVTISNIGPEINSIYPDYAPVISADEAILIFTSRREGTTGGIKDPIDNQFMEDIYISYKDNEKWTIPENISTLINTASHDASVGLSSDGQNLFIYRDENAGDLFSCRLIGDQWSEPVPLGGEINSKHWEPSISINGEGTTLFFSSNRPGGYGGKDLYMCKKLPGGFGYGKPINLGPKINTSDDEDSPFIHPDGVTLYFSSTGHQTMGGYDIFKSTLDSNLQWSSPENLGYPINTPEDDIYFVLSADSKTGYYVSAKDGGFGDKDVYVIKMPTHEKIAKIIVVKGKITDLVSGLPLGAKIILRDNETSEIVSITDANSATGQYLVILKPGRNYGITVDNPKYLFHSENFNVPKLHEFDVIYKNIQLQKFKVGNQIVLKNIFFDTAKSTLRKESTAELQKLFEVLKENPEIDVEIGGHTDSIGSIESNQILSDKRAAAVVDYLVIKGIPKTRMTAKGYGENKPIADNSTLEGRQNNRRTVMEITYLNIK